MLLDDPALYANGIPHAVYDELRSRAPLHFNAGPRPFHAVLRHADAVTVLQDAATFSSARRGILIEDTPPALQPVMRAMLPVLDSPEHQGLRRKLLPPLMPEQIAGFKPRLEQACDELVANAVRRRDVDFVHDLAAEVPLVAFGILMGLTRSEIDPLRAPADAIIERGISQCPDAVDALSRHLQALTDARRATPRDDYLTQLAAVDFAAAPMTRVERNGMLLQIAIGGLETTRNAIAGLMAALHDHPAEWQRLRAEPELLPNACEEALRFVSPVNYLRRTTLRPVELGTIELPSDARVVVFLGAANRDPARFANPHALELDRRNARQHVALGAGPHFCMGAWYGRMQLAAFWSAFVRRVRGFALLAPATWRPTIQHNLVVSLPLRLNG